MKRMFTNFTKQQLTVQEAIDDFISTKKDKKASETIRYYQKRLESFNDYLLQEGITDVEDITRVVVDRYMGSKKSQNPDISNQTLNNNLRTIRAFVNFCINEGYVKYFKITLYPATNIPKTPYKEEEQALLLQKPDMTKCSFPEYRNWVIICHFLASGNRTKTVLNIKIKHVNLDRKLIILDTTKNNEVLYMPISDTYYPILRDYMKVLIPSKNEVKT